MAFFPYDFDDRYRFIWRLFGASPDRDGVTVTDEAVTATFGRLKLETPRSNVTGAHVTRDYRWWKAIGARLSFADDGLTFGTNTRGGVCIHFDDRVKRVIGFRDHSAVTVTVADLDGLAEALEPPA